MASRWSRELTCLGSGASEKRLTAFKARKGSAAKIKDLTGKKVPYRMSISGVDAFEVLDSKFFQSCWVHKRDLSPGYESVVLRPSLDSHAKS